MDFLLLRKIIKESSAKDDELKRIIKLALKPTHLYPNIIMRLIEKFSIHGMAHITGGGLTENIPRSLPKNLSAEISLASWELPEIFKWLQEKGNISNDDLLRIFNCGIGMVIIVDESISEEIKSDIKDSGFDSIKLVELLKKKVNR